MASKRRFFEGFFCNFLGINTHNLVKNDLKFENKSLFDPTFPKALTFGVWDLKTSLGEFGPKAFGKGLVKTLVQNPGSKFHKQDLIFSRIMRGIQ